MLPRSLTHSLRCLRPLSTSIASGCLRNARSLGPTQLSCPTSLFIVESVRRLSQQTRASIDAAVKSAPVVLFMKGTPEMPQCGFSRGSVQILGLQGLDPSKFAAYNVLEDEELRAGIKEYSEWPTIPQLYIENEFVGGYDILMQMHQDGQLSKVLEEKSLIVPREE